MSILEDEKKGERERRGKNIGQKSRTTVSGLIEYIAAKFSV